MTSDHSQLAVIIPVRAEVPGFYLERLRLRDGCDLVGVETILVDDGSPSETSEAFEAFCAERGWRYVFEDSRAKPFSLSRARNAGIHAATTEWLFLDDADMAYESGIFQGIVHELTVLDETPFNFLTVPVVYLTSDASAPILARGEVDPFVPQLLAKALLENPEGGPHNTHVQSFAPASAILALPKQTALDAGGYDPEFDGWGGEDRDFIFRLLLANQHLPRPKDFEQTRIWNLNQTHLYEGWRAAFRLHGEYLARKGFYGFHIYHPPNPWRSAGKTYRNMQRAAHKALVAAAEPQIQPRQDTVKETEFHNSLLFSCYLNPSEKVERRRTIRDRTPWQRWSGKAAKLRQNPYHFFRDARSPLLRLGRHLCVKTENIGTSSLILSPRISAFALRKIDRVPSLSVLLPEDSTVIGWGRKKSGARAQRKAKRIGKPFLLLEDGFLRSVGREDPPLSLVVDDEGIYYDATAPSKLEKLIAAPLGETQYTRARALIETWRQACVSKYNHARDYEGELPGQYVLVCDQTFGDASIAHGLADEQSFIRMLQAALDENPEAPVVVKTHPDVFTRGTRGYFDPQALAANPRIQVIAETCHPVRLIEAAEAVHTVTSQMGFEALLWGKKVRCFGMPFYAGWGLSEDDLPAPDRRNSIKPTLEQLAHAALIAYPRYVDPETGERCEVERILAHISLQRHMRARFEQQIHAVGFSRWKRPILKRFLAGSNIEFARSGRNVPPAETVAVWGQAAPAGLPGNARIIRIEDGFLRSVGLGADLTQPLSWVCDDLGLYYDASRPSRLESILAETEFHEALLARAWSLRQAILGAGLTKYNVGARSNAAPWRRPGNSKPVILVPGQVEDDASIRFGARGIRTNVGLLRAVRQANRHAHIVYKPHPDIIASLRAQGKGENQIAGLCDEVAVQADMGQMLNAVDEVHTLTSLAGFEALMRGKHVTCYGQPFYAGWGLTRDMAPIARRGRRLHLDELVAGSLILYPAYVSRVTGQFTTPEQTIEELIDWREAGRNGLPLWRKALRPVFGLLKAATSGRTGRREMERVPTAPMEAVNDRD